MRWDIRKKNGFTPIEYVVLLTFILAAFFIFQHYAARAIAGRWKEVGDSFGHGTQYDPRPVGQGGTMECFLDSDPGSVTNQNWIDTRCFDSCVGKKVGDVTEERRCKGLCSEKVSGHGLCKE